MVRPQVPWQLLPGFASSATEGAPVAQPWKCEAGITHGGNLAVLSVPGVPTQFQGMSYFPLLLETSLCAALPQCSHLPTGPLIIYFRVAGTFVSIIKAKFAMVSFHPAYPFILKICELVAFTAAAARLFLMYG